MAKVPVKGRPRAALRRHRPQVVLRRLGLPQEDPGKKVSNWRDLTDSSCRGRPVSYLRVQETEDELRVIQERQGSPKRRLLGFYTQSLGVLAPAQVR